MGGSVSMELFNRRTHLEAEVAEVKALNKLTNKMYNYELSRACKMPSPLFCFVFLVLLFLVIYLFIFLKNSAFLADKASVLNEQDSFSSYIRAEKVYRISR